MAIADALTRHEIAQKADVDVAYVDRLVDLGILSPGTGDRFRSTDVRRIRLIQALEATGIALAAIGEATVRGDVSLDFLDQPDYDRFTAATSTTFGELSAETGVPVDVLLTIREAMGSARPDVDDHVREIELGVVPMLQLQLGGGVRSAVMERALRVYGDSLRRLADTEADWWGSEILEPLFRSGKTVGEVAATVEPFQRDATEVMDRAILTLYHGHQSKTWMRNILEGFETVLERSGLHARLDRPPAIAFLDLTGYTRLTDERGDATAADLARELATLVQRVSVPRGGRPVKWLGDGVMFHFGEPGDAVRASLEMVAAASVAGLPPAHVGIHAGPVLFQEGDYFGRTVNLAARITGQAGPGELLVSEAVVAAVGPAEDLSFTPLGPVRLKGVEDEVPLFRAKSHSAGDAGDVVRPGLGRSPEAVQPVAGSERTPRST